MSISENVIIETPNLLGQLIEIFMNLLHSLLSSWLLIFFLLSIFITITFIYKLIFEGVIYKI